MKQERGADGEPILFSGLDYSDILNGHEIIMVPDGKLDPGAVLN